MKQYWKKIGLIYKPIKKYYWQKSHAALPTTLYLGNDTYRVYFTSRDSENKTYVGYFEVNLLDLERPVIKNVSNEPVLKPGPIGTFDFDGVQCTSLVEMGDKVYMYYLGWTKGIPEPLFYTSIGLAISMDKGLTFNKYSEAPIMERSVYDPWMVSGGTVILEENIWKMWYISGLSFNWANGITKSFYDIKYAESADGINWKRSGKVCLELADKETNISRPTILFEEGVYKAWYPYKREDSGYRIGYAESQDGLSWIRKDLEANINVSPEGWDSEALDKLFVFKHKNQKIMLYNGNRFGLDGIGMAINEQ